MYCLCFVFWMIVGMTQLSIFEEGKAPSMFEVVSALCASHMACSCFKKKSFSKWNEIQNG